MAKSKPHGLGIFQAIVLSPILPTFLFLLLSFDDPSTITLSVDLFGLYLVFYLATVLLIGTIGSIIHFTLFHYRLHKLRWYLIACLSIYLIWVILASGTQREVWWIGTAVIMNTVASWYPIRNIRHSD